MNKALEMLAELRRTESSPNVEAEALKRSKGGGGPWLSFTRQRRPPKPRTAKKGVATPRKNSPLAAVTSGDVLQSNATPDAMAFVVQANNPGGVQADRHSRSKSVLLPIVTVSRCTCLITHMDLLLACVVEMAGTSFIAA